MKRIILTLILLFCITNLTFSADEASLDFKISGKKTVSFTLNELKSKLDSHKIDFFDPIYEKNKMFNAFKLGDVLNLAYKDKWINNSFTDISFKALDGYEAVAKIDILKNEGGYIAFEDIDFPDWEPVGRNKSNPAPFYIVWFKKDQTPQFGYPWPWQLKEINLITFRDQFPKVYPEGVSDDSAEFAGFTIFKERCIRCHSISQQGGKVGPDLNAPKNILEYRLQDMVKEFIKNPSDYRFTHMPDHRDLSGEDLDNLIKYLLYIGKNKKE
ncbi:MAG: c-type cytochrome [Thermodesulfobacteriota bacterium]